MRHGHYMGYGYNGTIIFAILLLFSVVFFYLLFRDYFRRKNNPENGRILEILKQRYAKNEINVDEYTERKMFIEDEDCNDQVMFILKERYALGEIDSKEFVERINEINILTNNALNVLKEQYAKGQLTTEEFRKEQKER